MQNGWRRCVAKESLIVAAIVELPGFELKQGYVTLVSSHFGLEIPMPRPQDLAPTYDQVIEKILRSREASASMSVLELAQKISAARPSTAKDPVKAAEKKIKEAVGRQLVYLDSDTILPLWIAWQGVRFRMDLSREEVKKGFFDAGAAFSFYLLNGFNVKQSATRPITPIAWSV